MTLPLSHQFLRRSYVGAHGLLTSVVHAVMYRSMGCCTGGLPIALADRGHQVLTVAPRYDQYYDAW